MSKPKLKPIPEFASEEEEQEFWATADTTEYFDLSQARRAVFPKLKLPERVALERRRRSPKEKD